MHEHPGTLEAWKKGLHLLDVTMDDESMTVTWVQQFSGPKLQRAAYVFIDIVHEITGDPFIFKNCHNFVVETVRIEDDDTLTVVRADG